MLSGAWKKAPSERGLASEARLGEYSGRDGAAEGRGTLCGLGAGRAAHGVLPPALRATPLSEGGAFWARRPRGEGYLTNRLGLVMSAGTGRPIISRIVGAIEERMPSLAIFTPFSAASLAT